MGPPQIDRFETKAIERLDARGEPPIHYPIDESDLVTVERRTLCNSKNISRLTRLYLQARLNFMSTILSSAGPTIAETIKLR